MAWRISEEDIRSTLPTDPLINVAPFIPPANALTNKVSANDTGNVLNSAVLAEIERYLAAHFYALYDQQFLANKTADASANYQGKTDMGLDFTRFGQMAKTLDVSGYLATIGEGAPSVLWLGKPVSDQIDYDDRN